MEKYGTVTQGKSAFYFFTANITLTIKLIALNINRNMLLTEVSHCDKVGTFKTNPWRIWRRAQHLYDSMSFCRLLLQNRRLAPLSRWRVGTSTENPQIKTIRDLKPLHVFGLKIHSKILKEPLLVILFPCLNSMSLWSFQFISSRDFSGTSKSNPSIYMSLYRAVRFPFLMGAVFRLLICGTEFVNPLLLQ